MKKTALLFLTALIYASIAYSETEYYALMLDGKKIGYCQNDRILDDGIVTTTEKMDMTLGRMGTSVKLTMLDISVETASGRPISFESSMDSNMTKVRTVGKFMDNGKVEITSEQMGTIQKKTVDCPKDALMVEGIRLLGIKKGLVEGMTYTSKMFVPHFQATVDCEVKVGAKVMSDLFGRALLLPEVNFTMNMPAASGEAEIETSTTCYVNKDFRALKSITPMMGMKMVMLACDKEFAMSQDSQVDFVDKMLLDSPTKLKHDGRVVKGRLIYTIKPIEGEKISIPTGDNQRVQVQSDGTLLVTVDPLKPSANVKFPYTGSDSEILKMLKPTMYLQSDDEKVVALAKQAIEGITDAAKAAKAIEIFVGAYISQKNLSVGYASAAEVAISREGDCSEHAVLTSAMCRAVGIPSRIVVGLVYVEQFGNRKNIFGGHVWSQVYIDGKWIGIDATGGFGAGHLELATGTGEPSDFFAMTNTIGCFEITKIKAPGIMGMLGNLFR